MRIRRSLASRVLRRSAQRRLRRLRLRDVCVTILVKYAAGIIIANMAIFSKEKSDATDFSRVIRSFVFALLTFSSIAITVE